MKEKKFYIFAYLFIFFFTSCTVFLKENKTGVSIRLPDSSNSRDIEHTENTLFYFTISCAKADKSVSIEKEGKSGDLIVFDALTSGNYIISGKAFSDEDRSVLLYQGASEAEVKFGEITKV